MSRQLSIVTGGVVYEALLRMLGERKDKRRRMAPATPRPSVTYGEDSAEDLVGEEPLGGSIPGRGAY